MFEKFLQISVMFKGIDRSLFMIIKKVYLNLIPSLQKLGELLRRYSLSLNSAKFIYCIFITELI